MKKNQPRTDSEYIVEKTVETIKILEVLTYEPISITRVIERVGFIPTLNRRLKPDAVRRILVTLKILGLASQHENKCWFRGHKTL
jgi:hypothetical protein